MLKIIDLTAGYNHGPDVIKNINLQICDGEIVTIIGPNGAGKSTVLKSIFGFTNIRHGKIEFFGENLKNIPTNEIIDYGICYVPQGRSVFGSLTVEENLEIGAHTLKNRQIRQKHLHEVYNQFPILFEKRKTVAKNLSGGQQQMVAIGRALMIKPKLLLLDEPSIGLSPKITSELFVKCQEIKKNGTAILIVEQNANLALEHSDRGYVLELGENRLEGTGRELLGNKKIGELYLGK